MQYLGISIFLGLLFSISILVLAISSSFLKLKSIIKLYNSTSEEIKNKYGLTLYEKKQNPKYYYLELVIIATKTPEFPIKFDIHGKQIWIIIFNDLNKVENFQIKILEIQKKYIKEKIELTGWGLKKIISKKEWQNITEDEFEKIINLLKTISETENLEITTI